jgi:hypothetical protein
MIHAMSDEEEPSVLGALPHSRPHRRSAKRATRPAASEPAAQAAPAPEPEQGEESGTGRKACPGGPGAAELLTTAVQAAAELAEIGLMAGARALRMVVSRLPRP